MAHNNHSSFSKQSSVGLRSGLFAGLHTKLVFMSLALCARVQSYTTLADTCHCDLRLECICLVLIFLMSWISWCTILVLMLLPEPVWNSVVSDATEDRPFLNAALGGPALWVCMVYHFLAKLLLLLDASISLIFSQTLFVAMVTSYNIVLFKVTELFRYILLTVFVYGDRKSVV